MKGADHLLIDRCALEAEPLQVLHHGQPRSRHPIADGGCIPVGRLSTEQVGQYLHGGALALEAGGDRLVERRRHALESEAAHRVDHIMPLHHSLAADHSGHSRRAEDAAASGLPK